MAQASIENPTVIERFVSLLPIPYPLAALVWSCLLGPPAFSAIQYVTTGTNTLTVPNLPNTVLNVLITFYSFLMVHSMRLRVVAAEAPIAARLSGGSQEYQAAFGRMSQTAPVILMGATLGTALLASYAAAGTLAYRPELFLFNVILVYVNSLAFSTYFWEFIVASLGLRKLGGSSLNLESFLEDRLMGAKPMGNLALSLTVAYFGGLLLADLLFSTFLPSTPIGTAAFIGFVLLGVALFFLPLGTVHAKMQAEKRRLLREIGIRYRHLHEAPSPPKSDATLDDVRITLARLTDFQELEMLDRKIGSLPTWPFDIQVATKFITIVVSVTAVLSARLITDFLHI